MPQGSTHKLVCTQNLLFKLYFTMWAMNMYVIKKNHFFNNTLIKSSKRKQKRNDWMFLNKKLSVNWIKILSWFTVLNFFFSNYLPKMNCVAKTVNKHLYCIFWRTYFTGWTAATQTFYTTQKVGASLFLKHLVINNFQKYYWVRVLMMYYFLIQKMVTRDFLCDTF